MNIYGRENKQRYVTKKTHEDLPAGSEVWAYRDNDFLILETNDGKITKIDKSYFLFGIESKLPDMSLTGLAVEQMSLDIDKQVINEINTMIYNSSIKTVNGPLFDEKEVLSILNTSGICRISSFLSEQEVNDGIKNTDILLKEDTINNKTIK